MDADQHARLAAIVEDARRVRRPVSRGVWIAALVVGAACVAAFVAMVLAEPAPLASSPPGPPVAAGDRGGRGFPLGLALGLAIGGVVGFLTARQLAGHSSRNSP